VIVRLTDFTSVCPQGTFLRNNRLCELCLTTRNKIHSVRYRCVKRSFGASAVNYAADFLHELLKVDSRVSLFVTPSRFAMAKFIEGGLPPNRIALLPQFIRVDDAPPVRGQGNYILYFGRVAPDKGIQNLVRAFAALRGSRISGSVTLRIVGPDHDGEKRRLAELISRERVAGVTVLGPLQDPERLDEMIRGALFTVVPSLWYDPIPNSILESYKWYRPVVASQIGSFHEAVVHGKTGLLCDTKDIPTFSAALASLIAVPELRESMGLEGNRWVREHASPEAHYRTLTELFERVRPGATLASR
jgi:glycosyltransferase involved in cell wall biosynthesis